MIQKLGGHGMATGRLLDGLVQGPVELLLIAHKALAAMGAVEPVGRRQQKGSAAAGAVVQAGPWIE